MIIIRTVDDIRWLEQKRLLHTWYLNHVHEFLLLLYTASNQGVNLEEFTLDGTAEIIVLEPWDQPQGLFCAHCSRQSRAS
jgi:hypothetical protein